MRTETITLYKFEELPEETQEKIVSTWRNNDTPHWLDENTQTLDEFCSIFPVKVTDWEYGYCNYINWQMETIDYYYQEEIETMIDVRLMKYIINNYYQYLFKPAWIKSIQNHTIRHPRIRHEKLSNGKIFSSYSSAIKESNSGILTGYYLDDVILGPIYNFLKNPDNTTTLYDLINDCLNEWLDACREDYEYWLSEDSIKDDIAANEYEFTINGEIY